MVQLPISNLEKKKVTLTFDKYKGKKSISACAIINDESFISCGFSDGKIGLFDHRVEAGIIEIPAHTGWINDISFHLILYNFGLKKPLLFFPT